MRDVRVTIAKAIEILFMVAVHSGMQKVGTDFIAMFHIPLSIKQLANFPII